MELCICVFVSAHACFCVFIVVCTCVWRVVWGPDVRDHQMRALAKVYTSTTPECQAGGSSVLSCPFCIQRTCTISHLYILRVFSFYDSDEDGDNNADKQWYIIWGPVPARVFWVVRMTVVMMTVVMFMMLMAMRTMTSSISHVRACACAYQICRATLRLQLFASWPRWRWCVSQFLNKDFLQNFVSRANWHIFCNVQTLPSNIFWTWLYRADQQCDLSARKDNVWMKSGKRSLRSSPDTDIPGTVYPVPRAPLYVHHAHTTPSTLSYISLLPGWWNIDSISPNIRPPSKPYIPNTCQLLCQLSPWLHCPTEPFLLRQTSLFCPSCVDLSYACSVFYKLLPLWCVEN